MTLVIKLRAMFLNFLSKEIVYHIMVSYLRSGCKNLTRKEEKIQDSNANYI